MLAYCLEICFVLLVEGGYCLFTVGENCFLAPGFEGLNGFAFVRVGGSLLYLCFGIFFWGFFIFLFGLLCWFDHKGYLLLPKVEDATFDWFPLLFNVSFAVGIDRYSFLFHQHEPFGVEMNFLLWVVWIER